MVFADRLKSLKPEDLEVLVEAVERGLTPDLIVERLTFTIRVKPVDVIEYWRRALYGDR